MSNSQHFLTRIAKVIVISLSVIVWLFIGVYTALEFVVGYSGPLGSYTGQEDDRRESWILLCIFLAVSLIILLGILLSRHLNRR